MNAFFESVKRAIAFITTEYGITPGCVAVFQTHGKGMAYKPHVHCALTAGGITEQGEWIPLGSISYTRLATIIKENLIKELRKKKIEDIPEILEINDGEYTVYATYHPNTAEKIIGYLSHTANGVVINLQQKIEEDVIKGTFTFTGTHAGKQVSTELRKEVFVERYLNHIPPPHTVTVRYYGLYSNQYSGRLEELQKQFPMEINIEEEEKIDYCPNCHAAMEVIQILDPYEESSIYKDENSHGPPQNVA